MKKVSFAFIAIAAIIIYAIISCNNAQSSSIKSTRALNIDSSAELINRGKYLVTAVGCDDCHSPKKMGAMGYEVISESRFSGYPSSRPFNKISTDAFSKGWMTFNQDLTSADHGA